MRLPKSFYERPLTPKEAQFVTDNINIVWWYLDQQGLDRAEWFDVVIFRYLISVKRWFALPDLQKVKFVTVACNAMRSAIGNARRKSAKEPQTVSLYEPTPNDADFRPFIKDELCEQSSMEYLIQLGLNALKRVLTNAAFTTSSRVQGQLDEYEQNNNPIIGFIQEIGLDGIINEATDTVYRRYKEYCISNNFQALSKIEFSRQICKRCGLTSGAKYIKGRKTRIFVEEGDL